MSREEGAPDWPRHRIGAVSKRLGVDLSTLRYWETVFPRLRPFRRRRQRMYRDSDIALLTRIRALLYEEGYTIRGAREVLEREAVASPTPAEEASPVRDPQAIEAARQELGSILERLRRPPRDDVGA